MSVYIFGNFRLCIYLYILSRFDDYDGRALYVLLFRVPIQGY